MPNKASAAKRQRQNEKRRLRNRMVRSRIRTTVKGIMELVRVGNKEEVEKKYREFVSLMDRAVSKGVYHKNTAARKKSRVYRYIKTHLE